MAYRKFRADQLFDGYHLLDNQHVLITTEEGVIEDIVQAPEAGDDIQEFRGILSPGFINCHCHLELSHMKNLIPENTGLVDFVFTVVSQRHVSEEQIQEAIEKAEEEMLTNGIVAVGDICNNTLTLAQKNKGRIYYHNFIEASGFHPQIAAQRFDRSRHFFTEYAGYYSIPVASNSIVPHAPYSVADALWEMIVRFPGNHLMTIHNQETAAENELFMEGKGDFLRLYQKMGIDIAFFSPTGKTSLQSFLPKFIGNQPVILVHNVHTSREDLLFAHASGRQLFWCLCPNANHYISRQLPPVDLFVEQGCDIVLGTDSLASNSRLSILEEINTLRRHFPSLSVSQMLGWATINGARALQMDKLLGSFEKGKQPGVILSDAMLSQANRLL